MPSLWWLYARHAQAGSTEARQWTGRGCTDRAQECGKQGHTTIALANQDLLIAAHAVETQQPVELPQTRCSPSAASSAMLVSLLVLLIAPELRQLLTSKP
jgi:hypothetical protein